MIENELNYSSVNVVVDYGESQDRCVDGMCDLKRRRGGCVI